MELKAVVIDSKGDPEGKLRAQVMVYGMFEGSSRKDLPWAEYKLPVGARPGSGDFTPAEDGDEVWVDFPYRKIDGGMDTRRPRITGATHSAPGGTLNLPAEAYGEPYNHDRSGNGNPEAISGGYCGSKIISLNGSTIEFVPGGIIRIFPRTGGGILEILPDGTIFTKGKHIHQGDVQVNGKIVASEDIIAGGEGGTSLLHHLTSDVVPGGGTSGEPVK